MAVPQGAPRETDEREKLSYSVALVELVELDRADGWSLWLTALANETGVTGAGLTLRSSWCPRWQAL